jgi:hypothetical protein
MTNTFSTTRAKRRGDPRQRPLEGISVLASAAGRHNPELRGRCRRNDVDRHPQRCPRATRRVNERAWTARRRSRTQRHADLIRARKAVTRRLRPPEHEQGILLHSGT